MPPYNEPKEIHCLIPMTGMHIADFIMAMDGVMTHFEDKICKEDLRAAALLTMSYRFGDYVPELKKQE